MVGEYKGQKINKKNFKQFNESELLIVLIETKLNKLIFNQINSNTLSPEEISEELELKNIKPILYSDKLLTSLLFETINESGKK